ncbi:MAG: carboxymuconolactone decarboxylase family protein [Actinomycetota bacterium]
MSKTDETATERGRRVRREIMGDAHADRIAADPDPFVAPFQDLVTRYGWGEVWSRDGIDRRTRSLVTLGMMVALNRAHAFKLHVKGALNNGASRDDIVEVLLQVMVYCGAPAAEEGVRWAREVFAELDAPKTP